MNRVDDATGMTLCRMGEQEMIWAAAGALEAWIERQRTKTKTKKGDTFNPISMGTSLIGVDI